MYKHGLAVFRRPEWQPKYISSQRKDDIRKEKQKVPEEDCFKKTDQLPFNHTDYIVIGPLSSDM